MDKENLNWMIPTKVGNPVCCNFMKKIQTLCIIHQHPKILLGLKKRGFGAGRWNGFGGKLKDNESIEEATKRELSEEAGVIVQKIEQIGIMDFSWNNKLETIEVYLFKAGNFEGEPKESEEMKPQWFFIDEIPFKEMWPDDIHWIPLFLKGKKFKGKFLFGEADVVLEKELIEVEKI